MDESKCGGLETNIEQRRAREADASEVEGVARELVDSARTCATTGLEKQLDVRCPSR